MSLHVQRPVEWLQVVVGGLIVAVADICFATTVWFSWDAAGIEKVFQTIAVGVLGKASYEGGLQSALLGAGLHVLMATSFVVIYTLVARRVPALLRHPVALGAAYGAVLYVVMNFVVMPLSRVGRSPSFEHLDTITASVIAHMVFGVVCVLFARRALARG